MQSLAHFLVLGPVSLLMVCAAITNAATARAKLQLGRFVAAAATMRAIRFAAHKYGF